MPNFDQYKINPQRIAEDFKVLAKWRNFVNSGHTAPEARISLMPIWIKIGRNEVAYQWARYSRFDPQQCDQIWQNFATFAQF